MSARTRAIVALAIGAVAGVAWPLLDVAMSCRLPESEACVWGKAYLPLTLGISVPVVGAVVAWVAHRVLTARSREGE
jgi:hypothetical protein